MSAKVLTTISAADLMDADYLADKPQVHIHFLTGADEYEQQGYGKLELCCHGCGEALLLYFTESCDPASGQEGVGFRKAFAEAHAACPNRGYERRCPNYRSAVAVVDVRSAQRMVLGPDEPASEPPKQRHRHPPPKAQA
jgi:hypothetical protein